MQSGVSKATGIQNGLHPPFSSRHQVSSTLKEVVV